MIKQFLSSENETSYDRAGVVIIPIPYEATTSYRKGCERGPGAILEASDQLEAYDEELGFAAVLEQGIFTLEAIADTQGHGVTADEMLATTCATVKQVIADGKFAIALGGEHSITTGVVQAYQEALGEPFTVVQIDAHGDLRHSFEGSIHNHACVMRRIFELGLPSLPVGIRSISQEEADLIAAHQIPVVWDRHIAQDPQWIEKAIAQITTKKVFLTVDLDGLTPELVPGVGTPQPGGLSWYDTLNFLKQLFAHHEVIGCDVMELAPLEESVVSEFTAAKLIYKIIGYWTAQQRP